MLICCYTRTPMQDQYPSFKSGKAKAAFRAEWAKSQHDLYKEHRIEKQVEKRCDYSKGHIHTYIHIHIYIHTYTCIHIYKYIGHTCAHMHIRIRIRPAPPAGKDCPQGGGGPRRPSSGLQLRSQAPRAGPPLGAHIKQLGPNSPLLFMCIYIYI